MKKKQSRFTTGERRCCDDRRKRRNEDVATGEQIKDAETTDATKNVEGDR